MTDQPEFTEHPQSHTKVQGSSVTFSSNADGVPIPTFSWTKDGSVVTANYRISLSADNKHLTITNVNGRDRGEYRCEAHNILNTVKSNAATLTIQRKDVLFYSKSVQLITCVPLASLDNFGYFVQSSKVSLVEQVKTGITEKFSASTTAK